MEITKVQIADLVPDPANARRHDDKNLEAIRGSLAKFDQVEPLVVQRGTNIVIGGNGRLDAMKKLGWTEAAVHYVDVDNTQSTALGLALNRSGELAEWDLPVLGETLESLKLDGFDIGEIGFTAEDLESLSGEKISTCEFPDANDSDDPLSEQVAFQLSHSQADFVRSVVDYAKMNMDVTDDDNSNKNGNAIFAICQEFMNGKG